jgi:23S rRNA (adenine2503-C2)-methyltransferase
MTKKNIKGFNLAELQALVEQYGEKKYRATQLYSWLYAKGAQSFEEMTDISKEFRIILSQTSTIYNLQLNTQKVSSDGTAKFLFALDDGLSIESVLIPPINAMCLNTGRLST